MAQGIRNVCTHCRWDVEAWDDGNLYYLDGDSRKHYAYHPSSELSRCVGNDTPHLCLDCASDFTVDSRDPVYRCPACNSDAVVETFELAGQRCPRCKVGVFEKDTTFHAIS